MNKQNICILHLIERKHPRGAELFASQLARSLAARGFHTVLCSLYESDSDSFPIPEGVDYLPIEARQTGLPAKVGFQPSVLLKLVNVIRKLEPDIVIAHGADTLRYTILASWFCPRLLTVYRNIGIASFWANNPIKAWVNRKLLGWIDAVTSVSNVAGEDFIKFYRLSSDKVSVIPNAINLRRYQSLEINQERPQMRERLGLTEKDAVLISVGSLSPEKNQGELLTLVKELGETSPHLVLVGDGPLRQELEQQADELRIHDHVHFVGFQSNIIPFLVASDIFLLPSRSEGMPAVLIEAGMAGLPSVAYNVGGVREVIEPDLTGIIVSPHRYEEFKAAVVSLLDNPEKRQQLGALAKQWYPERFAMEKVAEEWEAVLLKFLKGKRREE